MTELTERGATPAERIRAEAREATRRALLEAGLAETIARGGEIPSIDAVVKRAGYTRGAFYFYFEDRTSFVAAMLDWVLTDILRALLVDVADGAGDVRDVIIRFNAALLDEAWPDVGGDIRAAYLAVLRHLDLDTNLRRRHAELMSGVTEELAALVREGQRAGTVRDDLDPRHTAGLILLVGIGSILWDDIGVPRQSEVLGASLVRLISTGSAGER